MSFLSTHNLTTLDYLILSAIIAFLIYFYHKVIQLERLLPFSQSRKPTKILSVIAGENLDSRSIEQSLYSTDLNYNLLEYSSVSKDSLLAELEKGVTVLDISSHGLNGLFRLKNETLPATWLASVVGQYESLECILLLYCNSYQDVDLIAANGAFSVGLVGEVTDDSCVTFARHFYFFLNKQFDYKEAFDRARLHLPVDEFPKFIYKDGRKHQWPTVTYHQNIKYLLTVISTVLTILKRTKMLFLTVGITLKGLPVLN